jgi:hypothetical protein
MENIDFTIKKATIVPIVPVDWGLSAPQPIPILFSEQVFLESIGNMLTPSNFDLWRENLSENQRKQITAAKIAFIHRFDSMGHLGRIEQDSKSLLDKVSACLRIIRPTRSRFQTIQLRFLPDGNTDVFRFTHPQDTLPNVPQSDVLNTIRSKDIRMLQVLIEKFCRLPETGPDHIMRAIRYYLVAYSDIDDPIAQIMMGSSKMDCGFDGGWWLMAGGLFRFVAVTILVGCSAVGLRGQELVVASEPVLASVPLLACSGLPCVEVTSAGGKHVRMLIDTGDVQAILGESAAVAAGLELKEVKGADGKPVAGFREAKLTGVKIGETGLDDLPVLVADLKAVTNNRVPDADGFLTYPSFKGRLLRIDFVHKTVGISAPLGSAVACKGSCGVLEYPTFGRQGPPIVVTKSFSVNGKPLSVQVDTCYTGSLVVYPNAVSRLGLDAESKSTAKEFFAYTDGGVDMLKGAAKNVSFDGLSLVENPAVYFATPEDGMFDGTVGLGVFSGAVVTFDFRDDWMMVAK